jgi:hypothetical protein
MNYEKPNVALVASAVEAVKSQNKNDTPIVDALGFDTPSAYQADE